MPESSDEDGVVLCNLLDTDCTRARKRDRDKALRPSHWSPGEEQLSYDFKQVVRKTIRKSQAVVNICNSSDNMPVDARIEWDPEGRGHEYADDVIDVIAAPYVLGQEQKKEWIEPYERRVRRTSSQTNLFSEHGSSRGQTPRDDGEWDPSDPRMQIAGTDDWDKLDPAAQPESPKWRRTTVKSDDVEVCLEGRKTAATKGTLGHYLRRRTEARDHWTQTLEPDPRLRHTQPPGRKLEDRPRDSRPSVDTGGVEPRDSRSSTETCGEQTAANAQLKMERKNEELLRVSEQSTRESERNTLTTHISKPIDTSALHPAWPPEFHAARQARLSQNSQVFPVPFHAWLQPPPEAKRERPEANQRDIPHLTANLLRNHNLPQWTSAPVAMCMEVCGRCESESSTRGTNRERRTSLGCIDVDSRMSTGRLTAVSEEPVKKLKRNTFAEDPQPCLPPPPASWPRPSIRTSGLSHSSVPSSKSRAHMPLNMNTFRSSAMTQGPANERTYAEWYAPSPTTSEAPANRSYMEEESLPQVLYDPKVNRWNPCVCDAKTTAQTDWMKERIFWQQNQHQPCAQQAYDNERRLFVRDAQNRRKVGMDVLL